jgi:hypothetical protein
VLKVAVINACNVQVQLHALNANADILCLQIQILLLLPCSASNANLVASFVSKINHHIVLNVERDLTLQVISVWLVPAIVRLVQLMGVLLATITSTSLSH